MRIKALSEFLRPKRGFSIFVSCFFIALFSWGILKLSKTYTLQLKYNIVYTHLPQEYQIDQKSDTVITISIKDNGYNLLFDSDLNPSNPLYIDVSSFIQKNSNSISIPSKALVFALTNQKKINEITNIDSIKLFYNRRFQKKVPVYSLIKYQPKKQFFVNDSVTISPDSVWVYGNKEDLDKINHVSTNNAFLEELETSYLGRFSLKTNTRNVNPIEIYPSFTNIYIPVEKYTESVVHCKIDNSYNENFELKTFPNVATITFHVGVSKYKEITDSNFLAKLDFSKQKTGNRAPLIIQKSPKNINIVKISPDFVDYLIIKK